MCESLYYELNEVKNVATICSIQTTAKCAFFLTAFYRKAEA